MIEKIKKIREKTGAGFSGIKAALEEAAGNEQKAIKILGRQGALSAEGKKNRELKVGLIDSYVHLGKLGVLIEVQTETDFAVRSRRFRAFVHDLCLQIASTAPSDIEALMNQPFIKDESQSVRGLLDQAIATIGENIIVKRFIRYSLEK